MKKLIIFILILTSSREIFATEMLKPSLGVQMKYQEVINKTAAKQEIKQKNRDKLIALRQARLANTQTQPATDKKPTTTPSKPIVTVVKTTTPQLSIKPSTAVVSPTVVTTASYLEYSSSIAGVDMSKVRTTWINWYNGVRTDLGRTPYTYDSRLDKTASDWNQVFAAGKGLNHHRRSSTDTYYNYNTITKWFEARGVVGKVVGGSTTTENVGYGYYNCSSGDCTEAMIKSIRSTFDFFMSEKGKSYDAHYRSIVQPYFTKIGLDIRVVPSEKRYYLTVHYITEFE